MKKKILIYSSILTTIILFVPAFIINGSMENNNNDMNIEKKDKITYSKKYEDDITTFSSETCFKKTYYIGNDNIYMYEDSSGKDKAIRSLKKDDIIVAYNESNGYLYCEEGRDGKKGWVKKDKRYILGNIYRNTKYNIDINLQTQEINVMENNNIINKFKCSSGIPGDPDTETPIGVFYIQNKGEYFFSNKYNQGARYYIKFFANYLIHSIPIDEKGNIIEEEKDKIGFPASHGCIRISMEDARWLYNKIPDGSTINIHY